MPTFKYRAYGARGEFAEGSLDTASLEAARDTLWRDGLIPFEMHQADGVESNWWRWRVFSGERLSQADFSSFTREFATLNSADIPLDDTLRILVEQATSSKIRSLARELLADVLNGSTLSDAFNRRANIFPADYVSAVRAGELGGTLAQVLEEMASLQERRMELHARVKSALLYPSILIVLAMVSLAVVANALVPSIVPILLDSGKALPAAIQFIVIAQANLTEIVTGAVGVGCSAIVLFLWAWRRPDARLAVDRRIIKLPVIGSFVLRQDTARFARTLGSLARSGVPLLQAATSARGVVVNHYLGAALDRAVDMVREGRSLHQALQSQAVLPSIAVRMISVGEEAGKLEQMLLRVAVMFEMQAQRSIERFMTILTPLLTIGIAILVGSLISAVMGAILNISSLAVQ
jgi:general secretion pathway protein F